MRVEVRDHVPCSFAMSRIMHFASCRMDGSSLEKRGRHGHNVVYRHIETVRFELDQSTFDILWNLTATRSIDLNTKMNCFCWNAGKPDKVIEIGHLQDSLPLQQFRNGAR